jgi:hypothetical protein
VQGSEIMLLNSVNKEEENLLFKQRKLIEKQCSSSIFICGQFKERQFKMKISGCPERGGK